MRALPPPADVFSPAGGDMGRVHSSVRNPSFAWVLAAFLFAASNAAWGQPPVGQAFPPDELASQAGKPDLQQLLSASPQPSDPPAKKAALKPPKDTTEEFWERVPPPRRLNR
ncbi:MAG: hypothetical protein ACRELG_18445, partial [Gemmataceae bacterium]